LRFKKENMLKKEEIYHHYCIVRDDLPVGVIAAQLVHAAGESNPSGKKCYSVVLSANIDKLAFVESMLNHEQISHVAVREPDLPYDGDLMAIGVHPCIREQSLELREIVKKLPLLKGKR
jgi:hypothetical protein